MRSVAIGLALAALFVTAGCGSSIGEHFSVGPRFDFGVSNAMELELPVYGSDRSAQVSVFGAAGGRYAGDDYQVDPGDYASDVGAEMSMISAVAGIRLAPRPGQSEYLFVAWNTVDIEWFVDTFGTSSGTAYGITAGIGYRWTLKNLQAVLLNAEVGVGFWDVPDLDVPDGGGRTARYADTYLPLVPVRLHVVLGLKYGF